MYTYPNHNLIATYTLDLPTNTQNHNSANYKNTTGIAMYVPYLCCPMHHKLAYFENYKGYQLCLLNSA